MAEVRISNVNKWFGDVHAVCDFSEIVKDGEFVSLLGPSGCGKSTMLRMIAGFERPTSGKIYVGDNLVSSSETGVFVPPEKRDIGMVFQSYAVWPHMNVFDNVAYPLKIKKVPKKELEVKTIKALEAVHLSQYEKRFPSQLSGGQQQRVALARALVSEPRLLLLDEPLSNLDAKLRESMRFEIKEIQKNFKITVIYVTHDQSEAMAMSDRIVVMNQGIIQQVGTPYEIYESPANQFVSGFIGMVNFFKAYSDGSTIDIPSLGHTLEYKSDIKGDAIIAVRPERISISRESGQLQGKLMTNFYLGDIMDYRVLVKDKVIRVTDNYQSYGSFTEGEDIYLNFDNVMVFSDHGHGEEIEIVT